MKYEVFNAMRPDTVVATVTVEGERITKVDGRMADDFREEMLLEVPWSVAVGRRRNYFFKPVGEDKS